MLQPPSDDTMPEWLRQRARLSPDRLALVFENERLTFAELDRSVSRVASRLAAAGVTAGDLVAVLARNGAGFAQLVHGLPRAGAVVMPLNVRLAVEELTWQLGHARARYLIADEADEANAATAGALQAALPELRCLSLKELVEEPAAVGDSELDAPERVSLSTPHSVIYTSGTSGRPKGALLTFGNHLWSAIGSALNLGLRSDDCWLACMPLFHVGGLAILLRSVIYGSTVVVHESFDPAAVNRAIDEERVTIVSVVAAMLSRMLEERGERPYPTHLRCVLTGGGPLPRPLLEECARRGLPVAQTYGLTEAASQVTTVSPDEAPAQLGSAGRPLFPTEVRIEDESGRPLAAGEAGEIVVRGPTVTPGYLHDDAATARALRDGWLHTGDIGRLDEAGLLYVLDRRDDLIVSGGENVYPAEVEEVLRSHPAVLDAAVVGLPDERWGRRVVAAVTARPGAELDVAELIELCRGRLARYKTPAELRLVPELPRNAAGKLLRRTVRDEWPRQ